MIIIMYQRDILYAVMGERARISAGVALSRALALAVARARLTAWKQARPQWRESTWLGEVQEYNSITWRLT